MKVEASAITKTRAQRHPYIHTYGFKRQATHSNNIDAIREEYRYNAGTVLFISLWMVSDR